jgi:hypothetical protein
LTGLPLETCAQATPEVPLSSGATPPAAPADKAANAWVLAQASRDPYVILIAIYIFAP